jgi:hypothetical protein
LATLQIRFRVTEKSVLYREEGVRYLFARYLFAIRLRRQNVSSRWVWQLLNGREDACFPTSYPMDVAVQRLAARVERWPRSWASFTREHVVGRVSRERVFLRRYPAWEASTAFSGRFEVLQGRTMLVGTFGLDWLSLVVITLYFGSPLMLLVLAVVLAIFPDLARPGVLMVFTVGSTLFSFTVQRFDRDHRSYLARVIRVALEADGGRILPLEPNPDTTA